RQASAFVDHVVDQAEAVTASDGANLVAAVGVEGGEAQVELVGGRKVELLLGALVSDDEGAAFVTRGQDDDQRGEHSIHFLRVSMRDKVLPGLVHQELVEL